MWSILKTLVNDGFVAVCLIRLTSNVLVNLAAVPGSIPAGAKSMKIRLNRTRNECSTIAGTRDDVKTKSKNCLHLQVAFWTYG